ncbi:MAG: GDP-mannose dehydrogenase [Candidatus Binataceae bacterium]|nr:GDP-mannose dehydrogenase [Candidatus Binataceae bacterium]
MAVESRSASTSRENATLVVGLGEVGGAIAAIVERTETVLRHDLERVEIAASVDVMHLCIPFKSSAQFEASAIEYVERFKPALTIIHSTVMPGTTRAIARNSRSAVAYSPVRGKHVRMQEDLLRYVKFVAALTDADAALAETHLQNVGMKTRRMAKVETLELAKLAETTYFGVCIAFAQELNRYADHVRADYQEAIEFFHEVECLPRTEYFPGVIGGHCVMPNIELLLRVAPSPVLAAIVESNERREYECEHSSISAESIALGECESGEAKVLVNR